METENPLKCVVVCDRTLLDSNRYPNVEIIPDLLSKDYTPADANPKIKKFLDIVSSKGVKVAVMGWGSETPDPRYTNFLSSLGLGDIVDDVFTEDTTLDFDPPYVKAQNAYGLTREQMAFIATPRDMEIYKYTRVPQLVDCTNGGLTKLLERI